MNFIPFVVAFVLLIVPFTVTTINIVNLFKKEKLIPVLLDIFVFGLGLPLTTILYIISNFKDYQEQLVIAPMEMSVHAPIASWSMPTIITIVIIAIIAYLIIRNKKLELPPLIIVICISAIILGIILSITWIVQISKNCFVSLSLFYTTVFFMFLPINYIFCSLRAIIDIMNYYKNKDIKIKHYDNKILDKCNQIINDISKWPILAIIFCIPLVLVLICILAIFGQRPDEYIKAFTRNKRLDFI